MHDTATDLVQPPVESATEAPVSTAEARPTPTPVFPQETDPLEAPLTLTEAVVMAGVPQAPLLPVDVTGQLAQGIPFAFADSLELVDCLGRAIHPDKRGAIPDQTPRILQRLGIDTQAFIAHARRFLKEFGHAVGRPERLSALAAKRQSRSLRGMAAARVLFENKAA